MERCGRRTAPEIHGGHPRRRRARVVFAGDLLEESAPPSYGDDCFPIAWPNAVVALMDAADTDTTIVPGHGDVMTIPQARAQSDAIKAVADVIRALHAAGEPAAHALEAAADQWPFPADLLVNAIYRGYGELDGTAQEPHTLRGA